MHGIIVQIIKAAKRDSLFLGTLLSIIFITFISFFIGSNSIVEVNEAKTVYTAAFGRIFIMFGFIIFINFYIKRLFDNREIEVILSRPISRVTIILSFAIGFCTMFFILAIPLFLTLLLLLKVKIGYCVVWFISLLMEGLILTSFTLFFSILVDSHVYSLFMSILTYLLSRFIGSFVAYLSVTSSTNIYDISATILKIISVVIPRLDLFAKSSWLVYGDFTTHTILLFVAQSIIFSILLLLIAIFDFRRKQF